MANIEEGMPLEDYGQEMREAPPVDAPFRMKASGKYKNSPMQKNFGKNLAINKKLDKSS